jgi:hypothetical protein
MTIFLSAFLLFQVQPLVSKRILPWFGGSPAVWTTCMLFFQILLLAGYLYAHLISTRLGRRRQVIVHLGVLGLALLALPLLFLPLWLGGAWKPSSPDSPIWRIAGLLAATVGLPFFALSSAAEVVHDRAAERRGLPVVRALERRLVAGAGDFSDADGAVVERADDGVRVGARLRGIRPAVRVVGAGRAAGGR